MESICHNTHPRQQGFLFSTFKWILYHFFFLGRSLIVDFLSFTGPSSLASLKEPLLLLLLRFIGGALVYDACISFRCLRSSSICKTNIHQESRKTRSVHLINYQCTKTSFPHVKLIRQQVFTITHCLHFLCISTGHLCKLCQNLSTLDVKIQKKIKYL